MQKLALLLTKYVEAPIKSDETEEEETEDTTTSSSAQMKKIASAEALKSEFVGIVKVILGTTRRTDALDGVNKKAQISHNPYSVIHLKKKAVRTGLLVKYGSEGRFTHSNRWGVCGVSRATSVNLIAVLCYVLSDTRVKRIKKRAIKKLMSC